MVHRMQPRSGDRFYALVIALTLAHGAAAAPTVWTGPSISFSKAGFADPSLAENQDRLTADVHLTRGDIEGMFNIALESAYVRFTSPAGAEWATGVIDENDGLSIAATNWSQLTFTSWSDAYGGPGSLLTNILSANAVVRLVGEELDDDDDIYLDLSFSEFGDAGGGGAYAYERSTPVVPEPTTIALIIVGCGAFALRRRDRHYRS